MVWKKGNFKQATPSVGIIEQTRAHLVLEAHPIHADHCTGVTLEVFYACIYLRIHVNLWIKGNVYPQCNTEFQSPINLADSLEVSGLSAPTFTSKGTVE